MPPLDPDPDSRGRFFKNSSEQSGHKMGSKHETKKISCSEQKAGSKEALASCGAMVTGGYPAPSNYLRSLEIVKNRDRPSLKGLRGGYTRVR